MWAPSTALPLSEGSGEIEGELRELLERHVLGSCRGFARTSDVVDAHVALMVDDGDLVLTSDPTDIRRLLEARRVKAIVTRV